MLAGLDQHRRQSGHRWLETDIAQPGMSDERQKSRLCGEAPAFPTLQGRRRLTLNASLRQQRDVTMLVIHPGSGAESPHLRVLRFRSPFQVRLLREACFA